MKKVVITGSNGLLGQKLVNLLSASPNYDVIGLSIGDDRNDTANNYKYYSIDITNKDELIKLLNVIKPDCIVNTAAMTNVDQCEKEKEKCNLLNVEAVETLVNFCKERSTHLIHISTDFIFDGKNGPYTEEDEPNPLSHYGKSKLLSEELIKSKINNYTIIRTILVYGLVDNMSRNNIVLFVKEALENKKTITMVDDQYRMPTLVDDLALACKLAIDKKAYGVFNISSNELLSIYEMSLLIADAFELDKSYIKRISTNQLNQPANRPVKTGFDLSKSIKYLDFPSFSFKERLQVFKNQLENLRF